MGLKSLNFDISKDEYDHGYLQRLMKSKNIERDVINIKNMGKI